MRGKEVGGEGRGGGGKGREGGGVKGEGWKEGDQLHK